MVRWFALYSILFTTLPLALTPEILTLEPNNLFFLRVITYVSNVNQLDFVMKMPVCFLWILTEASYSGIFMYLILSAALWPWDRLNL